MNDDDQAADELTYFDYFIRPNQSYSCAKYKNRIRAEVEESEENESQKYQTLFAECFGHHVQFGLDIAPEIKVVPNSTQRIVEFDSLTSYFIDKLYQPPTLHESDDVDPSEKSIRSYKYFLSRITENATTKISYDDANKGSNLITFLIGEIGSGKTLLICKAVRDIIRKQMTPVESSHSDDDGSIHHKILPVYFDFETRMKNGALGEQLKDIDDNFYKVLYNVIADTLAQTVYARPLVDNAVIESFGKYTPMPALVNLIRYLHSIGIRLIIFFDNMDGYHYFYSKYVFFLKYYIEQMASIRRNIRNLVNTFTHGTPDIGTLALSVVFVMRRSVYADCNQMNMPESSSGFSGVAFQIARTSSSIVLKTRLDLFIAAIEKIEGCKSTKKFGEDFRKTLGRLCTLFGLRESSLMMGSESNPTSETATALSQLGHHGNRSLVSFLSSLRLDQRNEGKLIERFFSDKPHNLILLYITHLRVRYTQDEGHFPNLFLVDAVVKPDSRFELAHRPHLHTYWLKYLILSLVYKSPDQLVHVNNLRRLLSERGSKDGYSDALFNLCLGSLAMSRESRCIEPEGGTEDLTPSNVHTTERGRYIMQPLHTGSSSFCFSFTYLQLVVDDYLMSYPTSIFSDIYIPNISLKYLCDDDINYSREVRGYLKAKMHAVLAFLMLLRISLNIEIQMRPSVFCLLKDRFPSALPDFPAIEKDLFEQFRRILHHIDPNQLTINSLLTYNNKVLKKEKEKVVRKQLEDYFHSSLEVIP